MTRAPSDPAAALGTGLTEVAGDEPWVVIADLHLDPLGDARVDAFVDWLGQERGNPTNLLILGDLFDVWVGPAQARLPGAAAVVSALAARTAAGGKVRIVPGNRDFLLGPSFERATGAKIDPVGLLLARTDQRILFVHGDELCTLDHAYQRMKRILRSRPLRWLAPRLPLPIARWAAGRIRRVSQDVVPNKPAEERSIQVDAVREVARVTRADLVCCGHAHEFRDEHLEAGPRWIVLDAWGGERDALRIQGSQIVACTH